MAYFRFFAFVVSYTRARYPYVGFPRFLARFYPIFRFNPVFSALIRILSV